MTSKGGTVVYPIGRIDIIVDTGGSFNQATRHSITHQQHNRKNVELTGSSTMDGWKREYHLPGTVTLYSANVYIHLVCGDLDRFLRCTGSQSKMLRDESNQDFSLLNRRRFWVSWSKCRMGQSRRLKLSHYLPNLSIHRPKTPSSLSPTWITLGRQGQDFPRLFLLLERLPNKLRRFWMIWLDIWTRKSRRETSLLCKELFLPQGKVTVSLIERS